MPPVKPFDTYKWRWLSVQPSESLLRAPVFLGVLRALREFEGEKFSSQDLNEELERVQGNLSHILNASNNPLTIARGSERNLFRNSGQYWKGTGLLEPVRGKIILTNLGHRVASGSITNDEFASLMISNTVLPNPLTYAPDEVEKWRDADLRIKPFEVILNTIAELRESYGLDQGYVTPSELISIIIPLAGVKSSCPEIAENLVSYRNGELSIIGWPNCAPAANDRRLAREFLLFLEYFEVCQVEENLSGNYEAKFSLNSNEIVDYVSDGEQSFFENADLLGASITQAQSSNIPVMIERTRTSISVLSRPNQSRFRREVLSAGANSCVLTNERTRQVVEAAHIIPVREGGTDDVSNGLCMRVDIHRLYDAGKIRIGHDGEIILSESIRDAVSYSDLPKAVAIPGYIDVNNLMWRQQYL